MDRQKVEHSYQYVLIEMTPTIHSSFLHFCGVLQLSSTVTAHDVDRGIIGVLSNFRDTLLYCQSLQEIKQELISSCNKTKKTKVRK